METAKPIAAAEGALDVDALYRAHAVSLIELLRFGFTVRDRAGRPVRARLPDVSDAEELCHEAFDAFIRQSRAGRFDASRPVGPYLRRIAMNLALKRLRKVGREVPTEVEVLEAVAPRSAEDQELQAAVRAFRRELEPRERAVAAAYFEEGRSQHEVAEALGLSRDQVYRSIVKVRKEALLRFQEAGWFDES